MPEETRLNGYHPPAISRTMPHSPEAEEYLLSCCMLDGADVIARALEARITPQSFYDSKHGIIFEHIVDLFTRKVAVDAAVVAEELKSARQLETVGGYGFLMQVSERLPTTAKAGYFIDKVRELALLRDIIKAGTGAVEECYNFSGGIEEFALDVQEKFRRLVPPRTTARRHPVGITELPYPADDDPNILLGSDDYLGRGGGMLFVSHAGAGKSSWIIDACMSYALGWPWMGIRCHQPRRSLIVQAEDSDRYIGKVQASFAHVHKLNDQQKAQVGENCRIVRLKGICGPAFLIELARLVEDIKPDLVVINPIYLYAEGDIGRSEFAQPFLLGLDAVNKEEKFGYILIHHTGKPSAKGKDGARAVVEDWESVYQGFGSSFFANWPRCSALLEPVAGQTGKYVVKLGKGGYNAGVTKEIPCGVGVRQEIVTHIAIRHSRDKMEVGGRERPVYYWEKDEEAAAEGGGESGDTGGSRSGAGRPRKYIFADYKSVFPTKSEPGMPLSQLHQRLVTNHPIDKNRLFEALKSWSESGEVEIVEKQGQPRTYRATV